MPDLLRKNEKQLDALAANHSRLVTKIRWVVEVINTFLKNSFKALKEVPNQSLPHTQDDYQIAGAFINRFLKRLFSDKEDHEKIVQNMKAKMFSEKTLKTIIETDKLHL